MLNYNKAKKTLPLSRNRQVYFSCMFESVIGVSLLRLTPAQSSRSQGFLSLLLLEDYINTSIHTYPVFARRINIVQRKRAKQTLSSD